MAGSGDVRAKAHRLNELMKEETPKKYLFVFGLMVVVGLLLELFVFNFRFWETLGNTELADAELTVSSGLKKNSDGSYTATGKNGVFEAKKLNTPLESIHFDMETANRATTDITISATDEANASFLSVPARTIVKAVPKSRYVRLHFSGKVGTLRIKVVTSKNSRIKVNDFALNCSIPMFFSVGRFLISAFALMLLYALRPKSSLYRYKIDLQSNKQRVVVFVYAVLQIAFLWQLVQLYPVFQKPPWEHHKQFEELTDAISKGNVFIDGAPPQYLKDMKNPYDYHVRAAKVVKGAEPFLWDHVYYKGRYYVYFGVAPVLLVFLPYHALTGEHLATYLAIFGIGVLSIVGIMFLLYQITRRWFRDTPFVLYLTMCAVFVSSCGMLHMMKRPDFYSVPIIMTIMLVVFGLGFWISARREENGIVKLILWRIAVGSICIALIAGSRPQLLMATLFGVAYFRDDAFKSRSLFSRKSIKQTIALCLPYVVVAAGIMWYNNARFDSPFDFGVNYTLTTNDMSQRGFVLDRCALGIFSYLFQPPSINAVFPFIHDYPVRTTYQGFTSGSSMFGGMLVVNPILWAGILALFHRRIFKEKTAYSFIIVALLSAVGIVVLDTQMAGVLPRYQSDFAWMFLLASAIAIFAIYQHVQNDVRKYYLLRVVLLCFVLGLAFHLLESFIGASDSMRFGINDDYFRLKHLIAFWV